MASNLGLIEWSILGKISFSLSNRRHLHSFQILKTRKCSNSFLPSEEMYEWPSHYWSIQRTLWINWKPRVTLAAWRVTCGVTYGATWQHGTDTSCWILHFMQHHILPPPQLVFSAALFMQIEEESKLDLALFSQTSTTTHFMSRWHVTPMKDLLQTTQSTGLEYEFYF